MIKDSISDYMNRLWNEKDLSAVDRYVHEKVIIHSLLGAFYGSQEMKNMAQVWLNAIPDMKVQVTSLIAEGNKVAAHWTSTGTHKGHLRSIQPTNRLVNYGGVSIYGFEKGKIIDYWGYIDMDFLLNQIR